MNVSWLQPMALLTFFLLTGISRSPPPIEPDVAAAKQAGQGQVVFVGKNGLKFQPASITAAKNEKITFIFFAKNHTLTQTSFQSPCSSESKSFDSGFISVSVNSTEFPTEILTVQTTKPIYFACVQKKHCELGMVGGINLPAGAEGLEEFTVKAKSLMSAPPKEKRTT